MGKKKKLIGLVALMALVMALGMTTPDGTRSVRVTYKLPVTYGLGVHYSLRLGERVVDPDSVTVSIASIDTALFSASKDGAITLTVDDTVGTTYLWSDGATIKDRTGLNPGTYSVTVTKGSASNSATAIVPELFPATVLKHAYLAELPYLNYSVSGPDTLTDKWYTVTKNDSVEQTTGANRPFYTSGSLLFDSAQWFGGTYSNVDYITATSRYTMAVKVKFELFSTIQRILNVSSSGPERNSIGVSSNNMFCFSLYSGATHYSKSFDTPVADTYYSAICVNDSLVPSFFVNNVTQTGTQDLSFGAAYTFVIGSTSIETQPIKGNIKAILLFNRVLTTNERTKLNTWLQNY